MPLLPTPEEANARLARYRLQVTPAEGDSDLLRCVILHDGVEVGRYTRNYGFAEDTFLPFIGADGGTYALYSTDYTATRVMSLPDCTDVAGEEPADIGFCPTGYFVPYDPERGLVGAFGFVAGCHWGDDTSWKIQLLELSEVGAGRFVRRKEVLGYLELPFDRSLAEAIDLGGFQPASRRIRITHTTRHEIPLMPAEADLSRLAVTEPSPADLAAAPTPPAWAAPGAGVTFEARALLSPGSQWRFGPRVPDFASAFVHTVELAARLDQEVRTWRLEGGGSAVVAFVTADGSFRLREQR